ncbi:MAG: DUF6134 family protein [Pseudomonadota bacterium]
MDRRSFMASGLGAAALAGGLSMPVPALADGGAVRAFRIVRDGKDIGRHALTARRDGQRFEIEIEIDIVARLLGIPVYRYEMVNREVWEAGRILSVDSQTNDDGTPNSLTIRREGDALAVDGPGYSGTAPADAVTTTYYAPGFLERRPWLSSQTGAALDFNATPISEAPLTVQLRGEIESVLAYDADGEWLDNRFQGRGELVSYEVIEAGAVGALWRASL